MGGGSRSLGNFLDVGQGTTYNNKYIQHVIRTEKFTHSFTGGYVLGRTCFRPFVLIAPYCVLHNVLGIYSIMVVCVGIL